MNSKEKLEQEPAFPSVIFNPENGSGMLIEGMSKRFYAACVAMQGVLSNPEWAKTENDFNEYKTRVCDAAFEFADELLKQEQL